MIKCPVIFCTQEAENEKDLKIHFQEAHPKQVERLGLEGMVKLAKMEGGA